MEKVILFSPETFNLAETTRCLEIAKQMPKTVQCIFSGYSDKYASLILKEGYKFYHLNPKMSEKDSAAMLAFDQGKSYKNPLPYKILRQRVEEEIHLIRELNVSLIIIGSTLSMLISARACSVKIVYVKPYPYSKAHLIDLSENSKRYSSQLLSKLALKSSYIPKGFKQVTKEFECQPFFKTIDLMEADYNLITTIPELIKDKQMPENYHIIGPIYANLEHSFREKEQIAYIVNEAKQKKLPVTYFAMGSSSNKKVIQKILSILKKMSIVVIAPVKTYLTDKEIELYKESNIHIFDWLSAIEVSKLVDFSIIHGGEGTVQTACSSGKPFLGIGLQIEQTENLKLCEQFGNCVLLKRITSQTVNLGVEAIQNHRSYSEKAIKMQASMKLQNGPREGSQFIVDLLE